jgi:hypothetical protein
MPVPDPGTAADRFNLDFLFADQEAIPTLVECKRFASTEARRQVVGQMIEYAANGHYYWSKDRLRDYAEESAKNRGRTLDAALGDLQGPEGDSPEEFFNQVQQNLREDRLRIVFFLEDSSPALRSVIEFLRKHMALTVVLLVEARQYTLNGTLIVVPTLFGYTEEARKELRATDVQSQAGRKRWDEKSYFVDSENRLGDGARPLRLLYGQLNVEGFGPYWGRGQKAGSFNPKAFDVSPCSPISVYSTGWMTLKFGDLPDQYREKLRSLAADELGLSISPDQKYPRSVFGSVDILDTCVWKVAGMGLS